MDKATFNGLLLAPASATVISPLTTLLVGMLKQGMDMSQSQERLLRALVLPPMDVLHYNAPQELYGKSPPQVARKAMLRMADHDMLTVRGLAYLPTY